LPEPQIHIDDTYKAFALASARAAQSNFCFTPSSREIFHQGVLCSPIFCSNLSHSTSQVRVCTHQRYLQRCLVRTGVPLCCRCNWSPSAAVCLVMYHNSQGGGYGPAYPAPPPPAAPAHALHRQNSSSAGVSTRWLKLADECRIDVPVRSPPFEARNDSLRCPCSAHCWYS
jgi:hypothetical protein